MDNKSQRWFEDGATHKALPNAKELESRHQNFKNRLRRLTKSKDGEELPASNKSELLLQIQSSQGFFRTPSSRGFAIQQFRRASAAHNNYVADRQHGPKRLGKFIQDHMNSFAEFVDKYSNIIEAVAGAGGPYGTIAYQTLSILFSVMVNKVKNDNSVVDMLEELRKSLPRLENWDAIYPTDLMRALIATAYTQIMEFSRKAAEYLSERLLPAVAPLFGYDFYKISSEIHKTLAEINDEAMYRLHQRAQKVEEQVVSSGELIQQLSVRADTAEKDRQKLLEQNKKLLQQSKEQLAQNQDLRDKLDQQSQDDDQRRMSSFKDLLHHAQSHPGADLSSTKKALMDVFPDLPANARQVSCAGYLQMSRNLLDQCRPFVDWKHSKESALLFISGRTKWDGRMMKGCPHSWLSPIATYITEDQQESSHNVAFFSCLPGFIIDHISARTVLSSIILQVLEWKPEMLRTNEHRFRHMLQSTSSSEKLWSIESLVELLIGVLGELRGEKDQTIHIVIDRLDRCDGIAVNKAMYELARIVSLSDATLRIKIAVIAETWGDDGEEWRLDWRSKYETPAHRLFTRQHWDQTPLTTAERSIHTRPHIWSDTSSASVMTI